MLILVAIIAAAILVPLILIGTVVLIFLPVVRRRRQQWQTTATSLGLQSDPMCMYGLRGLPVRIFWNIEGQRTGQLDWEGAALMGRHDMRGGRAGLRYTYCRALLEPPLRVGLQVARNNRTAAANSNIRTGHASFDEAFTLAAREVLQAQKLFGSTLADDFARLAHDGWQLSATDNYVQIRLGGDYSAQFAERDPALLSAALDKVVHCARGLVDARRLLPPTAVEQNLIAAWQISARRLGLDVGQAMLLGKYGGLDVEVYVDCIQQREWRTIFNARLLRPQRSSLYLTRKGTIDRIWELRGKQVVESVGLGEPTIEQSFDACGSNQGVPDQALALSARQQLPRLCARAADVVIEDSKVEASVPGFLSEANDLREVLDAITALASCIG